MPDAANISAADISPRRRHYRYAADIFADTPLPPLPLFRLFMASGLFRRRRSLRFSLMPAATLLPFLRHYVSLMPAIDISALLSRSMLS